MLNFLSSSFLKIFNIVDLGFIGIKVVTCTLVSMINIVSLIILLVFRELVLQFVSL